MKEILLGNRTIRRVVAAGAAIVALGGMVYAEVDNKIINSPAKIENRVGQLVPDYKPREFLAARKVIFDFNSQANDLITRDAKTIEVPENVIQAATFIREKQEIYSEGRKLSQEMRDNTMDKNLKEAWGGVALYLSGILVLVADLFRSRNRKAKETASNLAQTSS